MLPADRTLAMAAEQFRLFRDEFAVLAVQAISSDRLDHAEKLFQAAARIDPESPEVKAGLKVLARVRGGELKTEKVKAWVAGGVKLDRALTELAQAGPAAARPAAGPAGAGRSRHDAPAGPVPGRSATPSPRPAPPRRCWRPSSARSSMTPFAAPVGCSTPTRTRPTRT